MKTLARSALSVGLASGLLLGCNAAQAPLVGPGEPSQRPAIVERGGPFLYVGGLKLAMYALGSSKPVHLANINPSTVYTAAIALDLHGHLCEANGEISYAQLFEYDAHTLKFRRGLTGVGAYPALVADRLGYLYASTGGGVIVVYAPGCTHEVNVIRRGVDAVGPLVFDRLGNLYAGMQPHFAVSVYAPTGRPGHMKLVRRITDGIDNPIALASGPSGDLFVANYPASVKGHGNIAVYRPGGSKPILRITSGIRLPWALAVDSKNRLYVDNNPSAWGGTGSSGWISVYAPGSAQPLRIVNVKDPVALALDASDQLYVANLLNHSSVLVYSADAKKLLQTIKDGTDAPSALLIGSP